MPSGKDGLNWFAQIPVVLTPTYVCIVSIILGVLHFAFANADNKEVFDSQQDFILEERDLLPEGVAFDPAY